MNVSKVKYLFRRKLIKFLLISDTGGSEEKLRVLPTWVEPVAPRNDEREIARQSWIVDSTPYIPDSSYWIPGLCQWNMDSGFQTLVEFRIPKPKISDFISKSFQDTNSTRKNVPDSGIRIPLYGAKPMPFR